MTLFQKVATLLLFSVGVALIIISFVLFSQPVHANTLVGNEGNCTFLAQVSQQMAEVRDQGMTWDQAKDQIEANIAEAKGQPNSLINDDDDAAYVRETGNQVWHEYKDMNPFDVGMQVLVECIKAKHV